MRPLSSYFVFRSIDPTISLHKNYVVVTIFKFSILRARVTIFRNM